MLPKTSKEEKESRYTRMGERAAQGEYALVLPLDYKLMNEMPPEGTIFGDLYPIGTTVRELQRKFPDLPGTVISSRVRSLHVQNLIVKVHTVGAGSEMRGRGHSSIGAAWQMSETGQKLVNEWRKESQQNGNQST